MKSTLAIACLSGAALIAGCSLVTDPTPTRAEVESMGMLALQARAPAAFKKLDHWAAQGMPVAQRELGLAYAREPQRHTEAARWLQEAAKLGDQEAQFEWAQALHAGALGQPQNDLQAWQLYEQAALQGNGKASFMLARLASHGQGHSKDLALAVHWLQEASRQKNAQAMYQLSVSYANGEGTPPNAYLARYWLNMSAENDYSIAVQALAMELKGLGGETSPFAQRSRTLFKEASDHRLMRWNTHQ